MQQAPQYFARLRTEATVTRRYRELAKKHHPDVGGSHETMTEINRQYAEALRRLAAPKSHSANEAGKGTANDEKTPPRASEGGSFSDVMDDMPAEIIRAQNDIRQVILEAGVKIADSLIDAGGDILRRIVRERTGVR